MKRLSEYINEGIFGDNVKSAIKINGVEIYEPEWKQCVEYFKKRRDKYFQRFGNRDKVYLGDMTTNHTILYNEDDCIICKNDEETDYNEIYILCPETIYMNHQTDECCTGRNYQFSLTDIDDANDYSISFVYYSDTNNWGWLEGCHSYRGQEKALKEVGINKGYLPTTISSKAQNIIKKYMKH